MDVGELPPVKAERREGADGTVLYVDPVALAALELAKSAGMSRAADIASLPQAEELPLRLVVAETRIEILEREVNRLRVTASNG